MNQQARFGLLVALIIASGCQDIPPSPNQVIPNSGELVGSLSAAKGNTEALGAHAKQHFRPLRMREGELLFDKAKTAHNAAISQMIVALGEPAGSLPKSKLETMLASADARREKFYGWYKSTIGGSDDTSNGEVSASASIDFVGIAGIISDWLLLQQQLNQEQRNSLRTQLGECKWRNWDQL